VSGGANQDGAEGPSGRGHLRRTVVTIPPGGTMPCGLAAWDDAIVGLERGVIELQARDGSSHRFRPGALLCLAAVPTATLRNPGWVPALLVAVSRAAPSDAANRSPLGRR
jgi:hypothetical protein